MFSFLDLMLYLSIILILAEEFLQDNFIGFHYRMGIKVDQREFDFGSEDAKPVLGKKATTKDATYFCSPDGKSCFFRLKHFIYNPLFTLYKHYPRKDTAPSRVMIVPVTLCQLKGEAVHTGKTWLVTIRMDVGALLFLLAALWRYGYPLAGLLAMVGWFFIIKRFGLPHLWEHFYQIQEAAIQGDTKLHSK